MISPASFYQNLKNVGVEYFAGVPDSLLKSFCAYVTDNTPNSNHVIAANEGAAVGLAIGYHLATGKVPLVYFQNSGLGNTVNPLMSLADPEVYSIPMLLLIGWRGEPDVKDEPQHVKQGRVMLQSLDAMEIPYQIISGNEEADAQAVKLAMQSANERSGVCALIVKKNSFEGYALPGSQQPYSMNREDAIKAVVDQLGPNDIVVATTGMASRELFEYRKACEQSHQADFLTVGGMGHASQIALGIAYQKPDRRVICIDGDGAAIMHLGSMAVSGTSGLTNFKHIVINNGAHDSVGGQPTVGFDIDLVKIAQGCGYHNAKSVDSIAELNASLSTCLSSEKNILLEVRVNKGNRKDLGRPTKTPKQNKQGFMEFLRN